MQDQIHIGPNLRRASSVTLKPNQVTDVQSPLTISRPASLILTICVPGWHTCGAFLAANRNFGWFNLLMASIHETHARHRERGEGALPGSWYATAKTDARARHIFNDTAGRP